MKNDPEFTYEETVQVGCASFELYWYTSKPNNCNDLGSLLSHGCLSLLIYEEKIQFNVAFFQTLHDSQQNLKIITSLYTRGFLSFVLCICLVQHCYFSICRLQFQPSNRFCKRTSRQMKLRFWYSHLSFLITIEW